MTGSKPQGSSLSEFEGTVRQMTGGGDTQSTEPNDPTEEKKKEDDKQDGDKEDAE